MLRHRTLGCKGGWGVATRNAPMWTPTPCGPTLRVSNGRPTKTVPYLRARSRSDLCSTLANDHTQSCLMRLTHAVSGTMTGLERLSAVGMKRAVSQSRTDNLQLVSRPFRNVCRVGYSPSPSSQRARRAKGSLVSVGLCTPKIRNLVHSQEVSCDALIIER